MAFLLGAKYDSTYLSKCENGHRSPHVNVLLTYCLILDVPIETLLSLQRKDYQDALPQRIHERIITLKEKRPTKAVKRRIAFLQHALNRLTS